MPGLKRFCNFPQFMAVFLKLFSLRMDLLGNLDDRGPYCVSVVAMGTVCHSTRSYAVSKLVRAGWHVMIIATTITQ